MGRGVDRVQLALFWQLIGNSAGVSIIIFPLNVFSSFFFKAADSGMVFSHLEAEWESFEKMMGDDLLMKSTDKVPSDKTADSVEPDRSVEEHPDPVRLSTGDECNSGQESVSSVNDDRSSSKSSASYDSESDSEENDKEEKEENKSDRKRHSSESSSSSSSSASDVSEASAGSSLELFFKL